MTKRTTKPKINSIPKDKRDAILSLSTQVSGYYYKRIDSSEIELIESTKDDDFTKLVISEFGKCISDLSSNYVFNSMYYAYATKNAGMIKKFRAAVHKGLEYEHSSNIAIGLTMESGDDKLIKYCLDVVVGLNLIEQVIVRLPTKYLDYGIDFYSDTDRFPSLVVLNFLDLKTLSEQQVNKLLQLITVQNMDSFFDVYMEFTTLKKYHKAISEKLFSVGYTNWQNRIKDPKLIIALYNAYSDLTPTDADERVLRRSFDKIKMFYMDEYEDLVYLVFFAIKFGWINEYTGKIYTNFVLK